MGRGGEGEELKEESWGLINFLPLKSGVGVGLIGERGLI